MSQPPVDPAEPNQPPGPPPRPAPPSGTPPQYAAPPPPGYGPAPYGAAPAMPPGYGPAYGYSDKTKLAAGLLQLLPGFFFAVGGIGRCYAGHVTLGVVQLVLSGLAWFTLLVLSPLLFGIPLLVALPLLAASWLWAVIDGIVLLAGQPRDGQGRPML